MCVFFVVFVSLCSNSAKPKIKQENIFFLLQEICLSRTLPIEKILLNQTEKMINLYADLDKQLQEINQCAKREMNNAGVILGLHGEILTLLERIQEQKKENQWLKDQNRYEKSNKIVLIFGSWVWENSGTF